MQHLLQKMTGIFVISLGLAACSTSTNQDVSVSSVSSGTATQSSVSPTNREESFDIYLTGYSYWDNTPPGSAAISKPVIHRSAGGTGTYRDPITIAVGHTIVGSRQTLDYPAGTRFYLKRLRKYVIVEDVCGDGNQPQNGPCHTGRNGLPWLDIYVDGSGVPRGDAAQCANRITAVQPIIMNPEPGYTVAVGAIAEAGCQVFSG